MSFWLTDPELFLYAKGTGSDDVHLWRCKKPASSSSSSSLVVPMKFDDFDYVSKVENHVELIGDMLDRALHWDESDYKRLVKYIYEKRLLVNSQGFVIAEVLHEADKDGNKKIDDANEEEEKEDVPGIYYIRSLDVLPLKPYIPTLRERPIPLRTVKYLGDANGKAALMEGDSQITKLMTRVENLEAGSTRIESKNNTLDTSVTKLTANLATATSNVADLQSKNKVLEDENKTLVSNVKTLEGKLTKVTGEVDDLESRNKTLEGKVTKVTAEVDDLESRNKTLEGKVTKLTGEVDDLESRNKTLEGKVTKLTVDLLTQMNALTTLQQQVKNINVNPNTKEIWMNDLTNSEWVGVEGLVQYGRFESFDNLTINAFQGTFTTDDNSTNVRARYWYKVRPFPTSVEYNAVFLEDLTPNKETARFLQGIWYTCKSKGKLHAIRGLVN